MSITGLGEIFDFGTKIIDKLWPDPAQRDAAKLELFKLQQSGELAYLAADTSIATAQADINKTEAASENIFVAGWRPGLGWIMVAAFGAKYLGGPLFFVAAQFTNHPIVLPPIDMTEMLPILIGMLGLGGLRTYEKVKGTKS